MSIRLKRDVHRWSRWYPAGWRAENAGALLGAYLDMADAEGRDRLTAAEKASLAAGGIAARGLALVPRDVQRRVSGILTALLGAYGVFVGVFFEWAPWNRAARLREAVLLGGSGPDAAHLFGPALTPFAVVAALAVLSWAAGLVAPALVYRSLLGATVVAGTVVTVIAHLGIGEFTYLRAVPSAFAAGVALIALVTARADARILLPAAGAWLAVFFALPAVVGPVPLTHLLTTDARGASAVFDDVLTPGFAYFGSIAAVIAAAALVTTRRIGLAATLVLAGIPFAMLAVMHGWFRRDPIYPIVLVAAYVAALAFAMGRASRRRPARCASGPVLETR